MSYVPENVSSCLEWHFESTSSTESTISPKTLLSPLSWHMTTISWFVSWISRWKDCSNNGYTKSPPLAQE
eukprot:754037-Hanusia_phi.AAC.5